MMPARAVGPISMTVRSPASRPGGSLHPRFAGVMAFDAGCAHGPGRSWQVLPDSPGMLTREGRKSDVLTEIWVVPFHVATVVSTRGRPVRWRSSSPASPSV